MKRCLLAAALSAIALLPSGASADVRYDFTALSAYATAGETVTGTFSVTLPSFVTSALDIPVASLTACQTVSNVGSSSCVDQWMRPDELAGYDAIAFGWESPTAYTVHNYYYFADGAFSAYGTYASVLLDGQLGTLVVSEVSAVPEPTTGLSLAVGLAGLMGLLARHRRG